MYVFNQKQLDDNINLMITADAIWNVNNMSHELIEHVVCELKCIDYYVEVV